MKKIFICLASCMLLSAACRAQFDTSFAKKNIQRCMDSLVYGFKNKDWDLYTRYSYPALVGSLGGKESFSKYVSESFAHIPDSAWKKYEAGKILQVIKTPGDLQAIVELHTIVELKNMRVTTTYHLVAESWDGGMFWTFFDSQNDAVSATMIKPDLSEKLIIPKRSEKMEQLGPQAKQLP